MKVLASSVIRLTTQGDQHGGLYLVDFDKNRYDQVLDYRDESIDWGGRGGERGLRGICMNQSNIYIATSNSILKYNKNFELLNIISSKFLNNIHEICLYNENLYIASTGKDSVIVYNIIKEKFIMGYSFIKNELKSFYCSKKNKLKTLDMYHINNVNIYRNEMFFSGTKLSSVLKIIKKGKFIVKNIAKVPKGTHNVMFLEDSSILYNDTQKDRIIYKDKGIIKEYFVPETNIVATHKFARPGFARGLCSFDNYIIGGSSPGSVSVYDRLSDKKKNFPLQVVSFTQDVRNAIHGLEVFI